jgi:hypothetical protein
MRRHGGTLGQLNKLATEVALSVLKEDTPLSRETTLERNFQQGPPRQVQSQQPQFAPNRVIYNVPMHSHTLSRGACTRWVKRRYYDGCEEYVLVSPCLECHHRALAAQNFRYYGAR